MSLADRLQQPADVAYPVRCRVCLALDSMSDEDRDATHTALKGDGFTSAEIGRHLRAEGYQVGAQSISRHRRGECQRESG